MRKKDTGKPAEGMTRREFMTLGAMATAALAVGLDSKSAFAAKKKAAKEEPRWRDDYCVQTNIDLSKRESKGIIRARVDGKWDEYKVCKLPREYSAWSFDTRVNDLKTMSDAFKANKFPDFRTMMLGPHSGAVASYGGFKRDSVFSINNAFKGIGWFPKKENMKDVLKAFDEANKKLNGIQKLDFLADYYTKQRKIYDKTMQVSLELYSVPQFETHSFLNVMENPVVSMVFLDKVSYEFRAITQFIDPRDPNLNDFDRDIVNYINMMHKFFHGDRFPKDFIAAVYHVIEVFDNSPGNKDAKGQKMKTKLLEEDLKEGGDKE